MILSHKFKFIFIKSAKVGSTSIELMLDKVCRPEDVFTPHWTPEENLCYRNYNGVFNPFPEILTRIRGCGSLNNIGNHHTWKNITAKIMFFENIPAWQIKCRLPKSIWNNYYKFTIERNPWDKCVSRYFQSKGIFEPKYGKELTFPSWFEYFENRLKTPWVTTAWGSEAPYNYPRYANPWTDEILVDKICRYENLEEELADVFNMLRVPFGGLNDYHAKANYRTDRTHYSEFFAEKKHQPYIEEIAKVFKKEIDLMNYKF
ncbi:MAG: hypothetical protein IH598_17740 [Bacteroidales bacterium]|nr:hypothetical protein [Bacteroidales bacterium]